jgi:hypothetical protein
MKIRIFMASDAFAIKFFLCLQGEPSFHLFGFIICVAATAARALKTVLQGILLSSEGFDVIVTNENVNICF